jgi:hypothetical protein
LFASDQFSTYHVEEIVSPRNCDHRLAGTTRMVARAVTSATISAAGSSRLARLAQNADSLIDPVRSISRKRWLVMRKPLMTKKTSTPT